MTDLHQRLILLGLDGATFQLLDPLMDEGVLPNLKTILQVGSRGILNSTMPPSTAPAWVSSVTGVNPGKHGCFDFRGPLDADRRRPLIDSRAIRTIPLWSILNQHGRRAGIVNLPVSYPPQPLDGFMITGMMTPGADVAYTYPPALQERLGDYVIDLKSQAYEIVSVDDARRFLHDASTMFERRWQASTRLIDEEDWDLFMVVFVVFDRIQHRLWKYLDPRNELAHTPDGQRVREAALAVYRRVDERLGSLLLHLRTNTSALVISDHGFGPMNAFFNVNRWLADQGLLSLAAAGSFRSRLFRLAADLGARPAVRRLLPGAVDRRIREQIRGQRTLLKQSIEDKVDWALSAAYFPSNLEQAIYLLAEEETTLRERIVDGLRALTLPRDGQPLVDEIYFREDLFHGPAAHQAGSIYLKCRDFAVLGNAQLGRDKWFTYLDADPRGFHRSEGILIAVGPNFRAGARLAPASIVDVTPTALHVLGLPVPAYMDGQVVEEAFTPAYRADHPVIRDEDASPEPGPGLAASDFSDQEADLIAGRLRALGYLE